MAVRSGHRRQKQCIIRLSQTHFFPTLKNADKESKPCFVKKTTMLRKRALSFRDQPILPWIYRVRMSSSITSLSPIQVRIPHLSNILVSRYISKAWTMDTLSVKYREYSNRFLPGILEAHAGHPIDHLTTANLQICVSNATQAQRQSAPTCFDVPWLWLIILYLLPWLLFLIFGCLYMFSSRSSVQQPPPRKASTIKVRIPGVNGPITPQSPTVRRDSGYEMNPFLQPVKARRSVNAVEPRSPGYLPAYVPEQ